MQITARETVFAVISITTESRIIIFSEKKKKIDKKTFPIIFKICIQNKRFKLELGKVNVNFFNSFRCYFAILRLFFGQLMFVCKIANDILLYVVFKLGRKMLHDPCQIKTNYHGSPNQGIEVLDTIKRKSIDFFYDSRENVNTTKHTLYK